MSPRDVITVKMRVRFSVCCRLILIVTAFVCTARAATDAVGEHGGAAYVVNGGSGTIAVIDAETHSVLEALAPWATGPFVLSPDSGFIWITVGGGRMVVLDPRERRIVDTVTLDEAARNLAVTPDGRFLAILGESALSVLDTATRRIIRRVPIVLSGSDLVVTPDARLAFIADGSSAVFAIDTVDSTSRVISFDGLAPISLSITRDGALVYVQTRGSNALAVIDARSLTVSGRLLGPTGEVTAIAVSPAGELAYVANTYSALLPFELATQRQQPAFSIGDIVREMVVSPDGRFLYGVGYDSVLIVDLIARKTVRRLPILPRDLQISSDGLLLHGMCGGSICAIHTQTGTIDELFPVAGDLGSIVLDRTGSRAFVGGCGNGICVLDLAAGLVEATLRTDWFGRSDLLLSPDGRALYSSSATALPGIAVFDAEELLPATRIPLQSNGSGVGMMAVTPGGATLYAAHGQSVEVIDTARRSVESSIELPAPVTDIAIDPRRKVAYIASPNSGSVWLLDTTANEIAGSISIQGLGGVGTTIAFGREDREAYVDSAGAINVIDVARGVLAQKWPVGWEIRGFVLSADNSVAWVISETGEFGGKIQAIDLATGAVRWATANTFFDGAPSALGLSPEEERLLVTHGPGFESNRGALSILDAQSGRILGRLDLGVGNPSHVFLSPEGDRAYVSGCGHGTCVVDTSTNQVSSDPIRGFAMRALSQDGAFAYGWGCGGFCKIRLDSREVMARLELQNPSYGRFVLHPSDPVGYLSDWSGNLLVLDGGDLSVRKTVSGASAPFAFASHGGLAYARGCGGLCMIDARQHVVTGAVPVLTDAPHRLAVSPAGERLYAVSRDSGTVSVVATETHETLRAIRVGTQPEELSFTADGSRLYVVNTGSEDVSVIDTATDSVIATIRVGQRPIDVAVGSHLPIIRSPTPRVSPTATPVRSATVTPTPTARLSPLPTATFRSCGDSQCSYYVCGIAACPDGQGISLAYCSGDVGNCRCRVTGCSTPTPTATRIPTLAPIPSEPCGPAPPAYDGPLCGPGGDACTVLRDEIVPAPRGAWVLSLAATRDGRARLLLWDNLGGFHGYYATRGAGAWNIETLPFPVAAGTLAVDPHGQIRVLAYDGDGPGAFTLFARNEHGWAELQRLPAAVIGAMRSLRSDAEGCLHAAAVVDDRAAYARWDGRWGFAVLSDEHSSIPALALSSEGRPHLAHWDSSLHWTAPPGLSETVPPEQPSVGSSLIALGVTQEATHEQPHLLLNRSFSVDEGIVRRFGTELAYATRHFDGTWSVQAIERGRLSMSIDEICGEPPYLGGPPCVDHYESFEPVAVVTSGNGDVRLLFVRNEVEETYRTRCYGPVCFWESWSTDEVGRLEIARVEGESITRAEVAHEVRGIIADAALDGQGRILLVANDDDRIRHIVLGPSGRAYSNPCAGDCDGDGWVSVDELIRGVAIALGEAEVTQCATLDSDADAVVSVAELIGAVAAALEGCPSTPAATPTTTPDTILQALGAVLEQTCHPFGPAAESGMSGGVDSYTLFCAPSTGHDTVARLQRFSDPEEATTALNALAVEGELTSFHELPAAAWGRDYPGLDADRLEYRDFAWVAGRWLVHVEAFDDTHYLVAPAPEEVSEAIYSLIFETGLFSAGKSE